MKIGITGLANSGKTTLFNALTGQELTVSPYPSADAKPSVGVVRVPDGRVDAVARITRPRKKVFATVEFVDYMGIARGDPRQNRKVIDMVKDVDAVAQVLRGFQAEEVAHPLESVDPARDAGVLELELVFSDLELVEKRLERMDEGNKKGQKADEKERALLLRCREALESEIPLRKLAFSGTELAAMRHLQFISAKPELLILNTGEDEVGGQKETALLDRLKAVTGLPVMAVPGKIEMEISQLSPEEADLFLQDMGISESAVARVVRFCFDHLGLISFITIGKDEVRAWNIHRGKSALEAAGKVHSDIERGFIRAEAISCDDFLAAGSMSAAREKGLVRLEGKTYTVRDGDIINYRFNV